jgi:hypothetical protein
MKSGSFTIAILLHLIKQQQAALHELIPTPLFCCASLPPIPGVSAAQ